MVELACVKVAVRVVTIFLLFFFFYGMNSWLRVNHYKPISKVFLFQIADVIFQSKCGGGEVAVFS